MPRRIAAPLGPAMRHCVCFKARWMCWRSASSRVEIEEVGEVDEVKEVKDAKDERGIGASGGREGRGFQFGEGDAQLLAGREQDGTFDEVFQFANVAGPRIVREGVQGIGGNVFDAFVELAAESLHEVANEERDVFGALAESGDLDGEKRLNDKRGHCERRARRHVLKDRCWWRRRRERPRAGCDCRRAVRIPALEARGEVSAEVRGEGRRLRRGTASRGRRVRSGRFFG